MKKKQSKEGGRDCSEVRRRRGRKVCSGSEGAHSQRLGHLGGSSVNGTSKLSQVLWEEGRAGKPRDRKGSKKAK